MLLRPRPRRPADHPAGLFCLQADSLESGRFSGVKPLSWLALEGGNTDTSAEMCSPTPKTVELLAVNANEIAQIAAPAEDGMENTCSPGRFRAVRNRYQPDNHRTNVAQNRLSCPPPLTIVSRVDYDHCGHVPFLEAADEFNRDVAAFMQRVHG